MHYNIVLTQDQLTYFAKLKYDNTAKFIYSDNSNKKYDSLASYYKISEVITLKKALDSVISKLDLNPVPPEGIDAILESSNKVIKKYNEVYQVAFKNIFNEDYY